MTLFILHHHLLTGGVTRICRSQYDALTGRQPFDRIRFITGRMPDDWPHAHLTTVLPELDYFDDDTPLDRCRDITKRIVTSLQRMIGQRDVIHAHNPNLGKNSLVTLALYRLAQDGIPLVYHCHDFAEDRPANLQHLRNIIEERCELDLSSVMYPRGGNVRFAVLTRSDERRLRSTGVSADRLVRLPNPVHLPEQRQVTITAEDIAAREGIPPDRAFLLYPVRGITRKNIAETALWAAAFADRAWFAITRAPANPKEFPLYNFWKAANERLGLPLRLELGHRYGFSELMTAADRIITTSIREGFGMAFLEPWLFDTPVVGRNLPEVTADFAADGIDLSHLYERVTVGGTDFARLTPEEQLTIIEKTQRGESTPDNSIELTRHLFRPFSADEIRTRREIITGRYSLAEYRRRLQALYASFV
jgi:glycosyltransferase involved in cell wall biosynthesis